ncbi:NAD-dependent protein deacetylase sirtuin-3 mitochondrial [Fasciola hepatica]|uniref:NAD-dependent protein deacetylase sirtuin-3 mitochondrial n=1 Tax=Fasciola hepatica TaxID=6192 RepID=A0A4E0QVM6_FASHE|nr:NAD-dependent protein deacetylase sirtuin-3 mitochondrial [Fasciola hepatica]
MKACRSLRRVIPSISSLFLRSRCFSSRFGSCCHYMSSASDSASSPDAVIARVVDYIKEKDVKRIVVLAGAGISTASGIPDFRTPGSGLYDNLARFDLPWPEAVFDLEYFYSNPKPFYALAKELYPSGHYRPNLVHYFIRLLNEQSRLLRVYTQNIDSLERMAGIPEEKLVEAHGTFLTSTCTVCRAKAPQNLVQDAIIRGVVAKCLKCNNVVKPDIVFFGENLPERFWQHKSDMMQTDLVFVMGTSLEVHPFAGVADVVSKDVPRVLFNRDLVGTFRFGIRPLDFAVLGEITQSVEKLAAELDWKPDLDNLIKKCEQKPESNGTMRSKANAARRSNNNASGRHYSTCTTPQLIARLDSLSISHGAIRENMVQNRETHPKPVHSAVPHRTQLKPDLFRESKEQRPSVRSSDALKVESCRSPSSAVPQRINGPRQTFCFLPKPHSNGTLKPVPRDALTALRAYLYSSSDSDSTESARSFLNSTLKSDENCDTKCSVPLVNDRC